MGKTKPQRAKRTVRAAARGKRSAAKQRSATTAVPTEADLLRVLAISALDGDRKAGLSLLRRFCEAMDEGEEIPVEILRYIGRAIGRYQAGRVKSMDSALGLVRPKHRESGRRQERHDAIAMRVFELLLGPAPALARVTAAREFGVELRTVERALEALTASLLTAEVAALKD